MVDSAYRDNRYEYLYQKSALSALDTVHTPLTIEAGDSLYLSIHEANLTNYGAMTLASNHHTTLKCDIVPWADGIKVKTQTPFNTPWRTVLISKTPGGLIESNLVLNLNDPNCLGDISWIKPQKYVGIWWGMHLGTYTWGPGPKHGATNEITKKYIDFASDHGFNGVLVEGWNLGWEEWKKYSYTKAYPDFNLENLEKYAESKGVKIIGHHETGADVANYERQLDSALRFITG
jgi:alpha-glucosidase